VDERRSRLIFAIVFLAVIFEGVRFFKLFQLFQTKKVLNNEGSKILLFVDIVVLALIIFQIIFQDLGRMSIHGTTAAILVLAGASIMFVGTALSTWSRIYMGSSWRTGWDSDGEISLIKDGPWRLIRHPIYAGTWLFGVGFELALLNYLTIVAFFSIAVLFAVAIREEVYMSFKFKEEWFTYRKKTRYFIPFVF